VLCDLFLLPELKIELKGRRFNDVAMFQTELRDALAKFQTVDFRKCFEQWCDHWAACIMFLGDYFEGDSIS
jgi:hypothetical protein